VRTAWKGSISCGLLVIPVRLGVTIPTSSKTMFHQIHKGCGGQVKQLRRCERCAEMVDYADVAKGAEIPGTDVLLEVTDEELEALRDWETKTIAIQHFTPDPVDPLLREQAYYVAPGDGASRACALLRDAMVAGGLAAVCRIGYATHDSLAVLEVLDGRFLVTKLWWPALLRPADQDTQIDPAMAPRSQELLMASQLLKSMTRPFVPGEHVDGYRESVGVLLAAKSAGRVPAPALAGAGPAGDMMAVLQQSLAALKPAPAKTRTRKAS
jgi:DNA end-binding protein Ku